MHPDEEMPQQQAGASSSRPSVAHAKRAERTSRGDKRGESEPAASREQDEETPSTSVGELRRKARRERAAQKSKRTFILVAVLSAVIIAIVVGGIAVYNSPLFSIKNVEVKGVEHLTSDEMAQLANVPADTTLLRVQTDTIEKRIEQNAWVADAKVNLVFPDTLEIVVTERAVFAVVDIPISSGAAVKQWAIAEDHIWLMPIPDASSDAAKTTSAKIYEDAANALHITNVPYGTKAEIGQTCTDSNVNNALDIIAGLSTELADRVVQVKAAGIAETTLILDNGVEVAFGKAEDIRDKERVVLQILEENPDNVSYINVRIVDNPTWRSV